MTRGVILSGIAVLSLVTTQDRGPTVLVLPEVVRTGDSVTIVGRFVNPGPDSVRFEYPSTCQYFIQLTTDDGRELVPGLLMCGAMLTSLVVPPDGVIADTLRLATARVVGDTSVAKRTDELPVLGPGRYKTRFVITPEVHSPTLTFRVRP